MENTRHWFVEKHIAEAVDHTGNSLTVWRCEHLGGTRAMPLFLSTYAELMQKGYASPHMSWTDGNKLQVVYLFDELAQQVAGGIAFEYRAVNREGWIVLSFTDPAYRGRRINQLAHQYFEEAIQQLGGNKIASHVHVTNEARLKSAEKSGFKPEFYRMTKRIAWNDRHSK
jgi:RimJ/RimL family protein N-acetyltransferase